MAQPKFVPKPGQVDYTNIRYCPVINVIPVRDNKALFVQRAADLTFYPSYWHCIAGFLDDAQSIEEKVYEELGWQQKDILQLEQRQVVLAEAPEYHKTYLVIPVLAHVTPKNVALDWEASRAQWFKPQEIKDLELLPGFLEIAAQFFPQLQSTRPQE